MLAAYFGTLAWQVIWHGLLPPPLCTRNTWLTVLACIPLLIPIAGLVRGKYRSMIWAGLLLMLYFAIGVMEVWSNPPQRLPALLQTLLVILCIYSMLRYSRDL